jgi:hypothetical protein
MECRGGGRKVFGKEDRNRRLDSTAEASLF